MKEFWKNFFKILGVILAVPFIIILLIVLFGLGAFAVIAPKLVIGFLVILGIILVPGIIIGIIIGK